MSIDRYKNSTPTPAFGLSRGFNISDLPGTHDATKALDAVNANTTSAALAIGARAIEVGLIFDTAGADCDLKVFTAKDNYAVAVATKTDCKEGDYFFTGYDGYDLEGYDVKVRVENISAGKVTAMVRRCS